MRNLIEPLQQLEVEREGTCLYDYRAQPGSYFSLLYVTESTCDREEQLWAGPIDSPQGCRRLLAPQGYPHHWPVALEKAWLMFHSTNACVRQGFQEAYGVSSSLAVPRNGAATHRSRDP